MKTVKRIVAVLVVVLIIAVVSYMVYTAKHIDMDQVKEAAYASA